uniref:Uncharacterized protein n=1 Tax=Anguilla anguilla TaxID=7936 RepID=A0A0E9XT85_ANGAN
MEIKIRQLSSPNLCQYTAPDPLNHIWLLVSCHPIKQRISLKLRRKSQCALATIV